VFFKAILSTFVNSVIPGKITLFSLGKRPAAPVPGLFGYAQKKAPVEAFA
jgi:hypothetical protein